MKVTCIADIHDQQDKLDLQPSDLLIIAGDLTVFGNVASFGRFFVWLKDQVPKFEQGVVVIAGNHDVGLDPNKQPESYLLHEQMLKSVPNLYYLNDSGVTINGYKIWGSPITPYYYNWAFNRHPGDDIRTHWNLIPVDTNILVTHGPPSGILDGGLGCKDLKDRLKVLPNLKLHVFGHIHPPRGTKYLNGVWYVNCALCQIRYNKYVFENPPIIIEV